MTEQDCFICRKHANAGDLPGGAIYEDDLLFVSHAQAGEQGAYLGYLFIETRRHVAALDGLDVNEAATVGVLAARLAQALKATEGADHVYAFVLGDGAPHFHMHIVPRYPGAPREFYGPRVDEWPEAPRGGPDEVAALVARVRRWLVDRGA
ncbi:MAG: HIT domain-containing protein [Anaerolineae bacterium]|nr:HIT domain-containing protein [Anaerolineae bacterium]